MAKVTEKTLEEYRRMLQRDPNSKVFAPLAEALRDMGEFAKAEQIAADGIRRHPTYASGFVALGRILVDQSRNKEALLILKKAADLDPENLLALQLLAMTYLQLDLPKEALRIYKRVLFLNPQSEKARKAVQKLESISADEYEDDIFQFQRLQSPPQELSDESLTARPPEVMESRSVTSSELDRKLSLIDALIVRNELEKARQVLTELSLRTPANVEIAKRFELLDEDVPEESADLLHPLQSRETTVVERKKRLLQNLLRRIKERNESHITDSSNG
jgi:tetratricopeptide (TPR) repeat protein